MAVLNDPFHLNYTFLVPSFVAYYYFSFIKVVENSINFDVKVTIMDTVFDNFINFIMLIVVGNFNIINSLFNDHK